MAEVNQIGLFDFVPEETSKSSSSAAVLGKETSPFHFPDLDTLAEHARQCQRCPLSAQRTHVVVERGNRSAKIMVIGEGPGQNEDETGLPFVGKAGHLLDKILASVGLTEQDVYICNVVKCRPPQNRDPAPDEIESCKPYLLEQIRLVNPQIVLLTGKYAMLALLGLKEGITKVRGNWYERDGRWFMPVFHPAYLLRNPSKEKGSPKWLMWQDIQAVKAKYEELNQQEF
ncbi:MAG: uracil-DNA glycosylase family protein [Pseudanabaenaceae cyanobacterium]